MGAMVTGAREDEGAEVILDVTVEELHMEKTGMAPIATVASSPATTSTIDPNLTQVEQKNANQFEAGVMPRPSVTD
ncbi:hypothetical protein PsorP6_011235 [Peronosclerospora sorghi]|uniref:Uncharacterized protein n=1 Tax=Peronosclerospora sorghi TaxID=230839 RepID=A0ACC0VVS3_9STRA|nr:hypothetical protein PsorP6_011235 [Peronosclerospora sorghi]